MMLTGILKFSSGGWMPAWKKLSEKLKIFQLFFYNLNPDSLFNA